MTVAAEAEVVKAAAPKAPEPVEVVPEPEPVPPTPSYPKISTVGFDARFPNQNQTKNCWQNYVDYFKCVKVKGEDYAPCYQFKRAYTILCPTKWTDKWDVERENNVFPALVDRPSKEHH